MSFFESLLTLFLSFLMATILGFGFSDYFTSRSLKRFRLVLAPVFGYLWTISFVPIFSAISMLSFETVTFVSAGIAVSLTLVSITRQTQIYGFLQFTKEMKSELQGMPGFAISLSMLTFGVSALVQGFKKFWGTVNPDFLQSWSFLDSLTRYHLSFYQVVDSSNRVNPFSRWFPDQFQARFGGVSFGGLLQGVIRMEAKPALITTILMGIIVLLISVSVYYKLLFGKNLKYKLALYIFAAGTPIGMSFIFIFTGQNSTLFMFPFVMLLTHSYLRGDRNDKRILALLGYVFTASVFAYIPITPLLFAIFSLSIIIWLFQKKQWDKGLLTDFAILGLVFVVVTGLTLRASKIILSGYFALISILDVSDTNVIYFNEWHSLAAFPYFLGISTSPISNSPLAKFAFMPTFIVFYAILMGSIALLGLFFFLKSKPHRDSTLFAGSLVFLLLVIYYTSLLKYGYAEFKLSSWFFFIIPAGLVGLTFGETKFFTGFLKKTIIGAIAGSFLMFNVFNSFQYAIKSAGSDTITGSIVNSYGQAGAADSIDKLVSFIKSSGETKQIALALPFVESEVLAGYLRPHVSTVTLFSHQVLPLDDKYLLNRQGEYMDLSGTVRRPNDSLGLNGTPDWVVLPGKGNPNQDIITNISHGIPTFTTRYYDLYKTSSLVNFTVSGRGFGREEYTSNPKVNLLKPVRWSFNGFELISYFNPSVGTPFSAQFNIHFDPRIGGSKTLHVFMNNKLVETYKVNGDGLINFKTNLTSVGVNKFDFRWSTSGCNFDPKNEKSLKWCNYALISEVYVNNIKQKEVKPNQTLSPALLQSMATSYSGLNTDGWFQGNSNGAWSLDPVIQKCDTTLERDGSNNALSVKPKVIVTAGAESKSLDLSFGTTVIHSFPNSAGVASELSIKIKYPNGSTDSSDHRLQIAKGSVRILSITCK